MRLTLRTLLAYLDDTLEASQAREIGQKVAESDYTQKLIERIKQVTRKRRVTAPPAEPDAALVDSNDVAEYLDNVLDEHRLADFERVCLESDTNLAEVAAVHQVLAMVLGEPAHIPSGVREHTYSIYKGKTNSAHHPKIAPVGPSPGRTEPKAPAVSALARASRRRCRFPRTVLGGLAGQLLTGGIVVLLLAALAVVLTKTLSPPDSGPTATGGGGAVAGVANDLDRKATIAEQRKTLEVPETSKEEAKPAAIDVKKTDLPPAAKELLSSAGTLAPEFTSGGFRTCRGDEGGRENDGKGGDKVHRDGRQVSKAGRAGVRGSFTGRDDRSGQGQNSKTRIGNPAGDSHGGDLQRAENGRRQGQRQPNAPS